MEDNKREKSPSLKPQEKRAPQATETTLPGSSENTIVSDLIPLGPMETSDPDMRLAVIGGSREVSEDKKNKIEQLRENPKLKIDTNSIASERHKDRNEDAHFDLPGKQAFGILDGAGGHKDGDKASRLGKESAAKSLDAIPDNASVEVGKGLMYDAIKKANEEVRAQAEKDGSDMGATITLVKILGENAIIGSAGDSPAYLFRDGKLAQITLDDDGILKQAGGNEEVARENQAKIKNVRTLDDKQFLDTDLQFFMDEKHSIDNALGIKDMEPKIYVQKLNPGDRILLASDGIENLTQKQIEKIMAETPDGEEAVKRLTAEAKIASQDPENVRRRPDDMTAKIAEILPNETAKAELPKKDVAGENTIVPSLTDATIAGVEVGETARGSSHDITQVDQAGVEASMQVGDQEKAFVPEDTLVGDAEVSKNVDDKDGWQYFTTDNERRVVVEMKKREDGGWDRREVPLAGGAKLAMDAIPEGVSESSMDHDKDGLPSMQPDTGEKRPPINNLLKQAQLPVEERNVKEHDVRAFRSIQAANTGNSVDTGGANQPQAGALSGEKGDTHYGEKKADEKGGWFGGLFNKFRHPDKDKKAA